MSRTDDDFVPVTGGVSLPADQTRNDLEHLRDRVADTDLDKHILRLFALHPQLGNRFNRDTTGLDAGGKRALLEEIYDALGVKPLGRSPK